MDMGSSDPDDIAAAFGFAFGLVIAGFLFLFPVGRPAIIGATFDIEPGMGQRPERGREIIQALLQQDAGHGMNHFALQPDLNRSGPIVLAVLGVDRDDGMNQLMHEDAENLSRLVEIGADENLEMLIGGCGGMPALANAIAFAPG